MSVVLTNHKNEIKNFIHYEEKKFFTRTTKENFFSFNSSIAWFGLITLFFKENKYKITKMYKTFSSLFLYGCSVYGSSNLSHTKIAWKLFWRLILKIEIIRKTFSLFFCNFLFLFHSFSSGDDDEKYNISNFGSSCPCCYCYFLRKVSLIFSFLLSTTFWMKKVIIVMIVQLILNQHERKNWIKSFLTFWMIIAHKNDLKGQIERNLKALKP